MKISDEMLSGFLDAELSEEAMEKVRIALESDDDLVMRLADLAQVDHWVGENATMIDTTPVSSRLSSLAQTIDKKTAQADHNQASNKVVTISRWKSLNQSINKHYALAAGVVMLFGVGTVTLMQSQQPSSVITAAIAQHLDQAPSGEAALTTQGDEITANLSFTNLNGDYCRQFMQVNTQAASINIACKEKAQWQLKVTEAVNLAENLQVYRTASNKAQLDSVIDTMISGTVMDATEENAAIGNNWQTNINNRGE